MKGGPKTGWKKDKFADFHKLIFFPLVTNQKEFFGEGFKGDKTFLLIILLAKWVYQLVLYEYKHNSQIPSPLPPSRPNLSSSILPW
jgi:hypothetical protein